MQTIPHVSSKRKARGDQFQGLESSLVLLCFLIFKMSVSTSVYKALAQSGKLLVKNVCRIVCVIFYSWHEDIKRLSVSVSKHKLEHLGFNLSHTKAAPSGRLMWHSSVFYRWIR